MRTFSRYILGAVIFVMPMLTSTRTADAHFLWIRRTTDGQGHFKAELVFSESAAQQDELLPEPIIGAALWQRAQDGRRQKLETHTVKTGQRTFLEAALPEADRDVMLEAICCYGVYRGALLTYYAKHIASLTDQRTSPSHSPDLALDITAQQDGRRIRLQVLWHGRPEAGAPVVIASGDGKATETVANASGIVIFEPTSRGLIAIRASHREADARGQFEGQPYNGSAHYVTLTLNESQEEAGGRAAPELPKLIEPIASFGAAVEDGWLYIYGGHTGEAHAHSRDNISRHFRRLNLRGGTAWEELPCETPLQSPALVGYQGCLYRVGGMTARNAADQEADLHSVAEFARFDPQRRTWSAMPSLPKPRSSHDAVVLGDKLYVVGGWQLEGSSSGTWCTSALAFDLGADKSRWQTLPEPKVRRRALAAGAWHGKLVVMGGMTEEGEVSTEVDLFDPQSRQWSRGADLPAGDMQGFGIAACSAGGSLYMSGASGVVYRLNDDGRAWQEVGKLNPPRFFHRLVGTPTGDLLAVGGAAPGSGHLDSIQRVVLSASRSP